MSEQVGSLVQRLRTMAGIGWNPIGDEAADRIEQLERSIYQLQQVNLANSELIEQLEHAILNAVHYCDVREGQFFMDELAALLPEDRE